MKTTAFPTSSRRLLPVAVLWLAAVWLAVHAPVARANTAVLANPVATKHGATPSHDAPRADASAPKEEAPAVISIKSAVAKQLKEAIDKTNEASGIRKRPTVVVSSASSGAHAASAGHGSPSVAVAKPKAHAAVAPAVAAHAAANGHGAVHWSYEGETGPQAWGQLQPSFNVCAIGKRQSPIHILESGNLQGPAEPLQIDYRPSRGSVVNNGHTIQVDVEGDNTLTVRGSTYRLAQFHFHHPSEEKVNYKGYAMVAHLVHRNDMGQLAVLAVLFDPGEASPLIDKVWTHMPLDVSDRVRMPEDSIDLTTALPQDRRYYQFMGSLTTPPCTEGVLWMVLKNPVSLSRDQLKLFARLFPNNARPVQPTNDRVVREAQ